MYKGQRCTERLFHELRQTAPDTLTVCHVMKAEDVALALSHPAIMLASDGLMDRGKDTREVQGVSTPAVPVCCDREDELG